MKKFLPSALFGFVLVTAALALGQAPPAPQPAPQPAPAPAPSPQPAPQPAPTVPVEIAGETSVPCYGFARLYLTGTYTSAGWLCFPDRTTGALIVASYTTANGHSFVFSGPPGAYDVGAFVQTPAGIVTLQTVVTIKPPVGPTPTPTPTPIPPLPNPTPTPPTPTPTPRPFPSTQASPQAFPSTVIHRAQGARRA